MALLDGAILHAPPALDFELSDAGADIVENVKEGTHFLPTSSAQIWRDTVRAWLECDGFGRPGKSEKYASRSTQKPILLSGPPGCGKAAMIRSIAASLESTEVCQFNCTAGSRPDDLVAVLHRSCTATPTNSGMILRPQRSDNLLVLIKDLNVTQPDKWGTAQFISFL